MFGIQIQAMLCSVIDKTIGESEMTSQDTGKAILENAYQLQTPADNVAYYNRFATVYDDEFALDMGWRYPQAIAEIYTELANSGDLPIADIGCGTGLVADYLEVTADSIEGFDISDEMLRVAAGKSTYGNLQQLDITGSLAELSHQYGAVLSAGTFTHGHLGPKDLVSLLTIGRLDSLFVIGVNKAHYQASQFAKVINELATEAIISQVEIREISMYSKSDHDHSADVAQVLIFRKN
jgi:predicted TPR repeat methyltransferase